MDILYLLYKKNCQDDAAMWNSVLRDFNFLIAFDVHVQG